MTVFSRRRDALMTPKETLKQLERELRTRIGSHIRFENDVIERFGSLENATVEEKIVEAEKVLASMGRGVAGLGHEHARRERLLGTKRRRLEELEAQLDEAAGKLLRYQNEIFIYFGEEPTRDQRVKIALEVLEEPNRGVVGQRWEEHRRKRLRGHQD
jgi:hypothetical protein